MEQGNVIISTDCISDLTKEILEKYHISTMYFYIRTEEARFQDTFEMTSQDLIEYMGEENKKAFSGCASIDEYRKYFKELQGGTERDIIYISVSKYVSRSYENAMAASANMKHIYVVDSEQLSGGTGLIALEAAEMAMCGASTELIIEKIRGMTKRVSTSFIVDSSEYLYRNGKISRFMYVLMDALSLHPVLEMKKGRLCLAHICVGRPYTFARGYLRRGLRRKDKIVKDRAFLLSVACGYEYKEFIKKTIHAQVPFDRIIVNDASATVSCNCGPGAFGVLYLRNE